MFACSEMQNVYSVKENVNSLNRDSLFLQGSKPVNIETSYPNNLKNSRTGTTKFVGREKVISILNEQLKATEQVAITSVTGMGGIGKTELALQYAYFHLKQKTYTGGICWLDCREKNVGLQIISFATSQFSLQIPKEEDLQTKIDFCWHNWAKGDVLIIFDDVVDYEEIANCLPPPELRFKVLITTRQKWLTQSFQRLELEVLDKDAALELLISYVGSARIQGELEEAEALCKDLGFLPLGLELVARYLERKPSLSLVKTRERLGLEHKSLKAFSQDMTAERGVAAAFELSWKELDKDDQELGCLLSLFAAAKIPWNLVEKCLSDVDEEDLEDRRDEKLVHLSLLQSLGENCYEFHPLIREFCRNKLSGLDLIEDMKQNICRVIVDVANKIPRYITVEEVKEVNIYIPHVIEIAENLSEYLSESDLTLPFTTLGIFYQDQGLYSLAEVWFEKSKEIAEERLGDEHFFVTENLNNLAGLYRHQGRYEEAESLYLKALEMRKKLLEDEHFFVTGSLNNLAGIYDIQGRYEEAESLYLQALEMRKKCLGDEHPMVAIGLNNLANLYMSQCRYKKAESLYVQSLETRKKSLGDEHLMVANSLNNLAECYIHQGRYDEAEPFYMQALKMRKKLLREEHPYIAESFNNLAGLYHNQGRYDDAEPLYLQALDMRKKLLGDEHPSVASSLNNLAELYQAQGRYDEAEPFYMQALKMRKKLLREEHPYIAESFNNLAGL
ncbi:MAG: tetratricopeptide repeat protein, partial [Trichodesmium sp. St15_bin1_1]|nr:tetratricopeptide repeat protein [Trichodesmium sp. St15_bin1_1]